MSLHRGVAARVGSPVTRAMPCASVSPRQRTAPVQSWMVTRAPPTGRPRSSAVTQTSAFSAPHLKCTREVGHERGGRHVHRPGLREQRRAEARALQLHDVETRRPSGMPTTSNARRRPAWAGWTRLDAGAGRCAPAKIDVSRLAPAHRRSHGRISRAGLGGTRSTLAFTRSSQSAARPATRGRAHAQLPSGSSRAASPAARDRRARGCRSAPRTSPAAGTPRSCTVERESARR